MNKTLILPIMMILLASIVFASNELVIDDITLYKNADSQRSMKDGSSFDEFIEPGDDFELEITIENRFREDIDIEDIEIIVTIENIVYGEDIVEDISKFDLNDGRKKIKSVKFDIPKYADELIKPVNIFIRGTDDEGTVHTINWTIYINIEDEDHEVRVYRTKLNQTIVGCDGSVDLIVWVVNDGSYDESNVVILVESPELDVYQEFRDIDIDEGEIYAKKILLNLNNISETKTYPIEIKTFYKNSHLDYIETVFITGNKCKQELSIIEKEIVEEGVIIQEIEESDSEAINTPSIGKDSTLIWAFSIVLVILVIILILSVILIRK